MKKIIPAIIALMFALPAQADISIGFIAPLTGQNAVAGEQMRKGAEQAIKDINEAGGVLGQKLKLESADDACDPKQAVAAANQMATKGVKYVVGHYCSGSAIPASKVFMEEKIILVSPIATNPKLTDEGGDTIFRVCGRDDKQGSVIAQLLAKEFKGKHIALLNDKSAYGRGLADQVKGELNKAGITETKFESFTAGEKDYSALVASLKQANNDVIFIGGYHTEGALITRQLREAGSKAQVIGGDALLTNEFWSITGNAGDGVLVTFTPDPRKNADAKPVVERLRKAGYEPESFTLYTYGAVQVFADALKQAGADDVAKVTAVMHKEKFKTVLGELGFDKKGDVLGVDYVVYNWKNGACTER
ncbi:MAG: branched-chain amino acid ABC transporter substrate-binding protein [Alphaproteobacteria bacterium]|nr:branched-chain amino acid ABC transporter substrate-binding protein [Alphaproteobacteria bacterium]